MGGYLRGFLYRLIMKVAHKYNWHYAPPIYPNGDTHLWCKWCGFRQTIKTARQKDILQNDDIGSTLIQEKCLTNRKEK